MSSELGQLLIAIFLNLVIVETTMTEVNRFSYLTSRHGGNGDGNETCGDCVSYIANPSKDSNGTCNSNNGSVVCENHTACRCYIKAPTGTYATARARRDVIYIKYLGRKP